MKGSTARSRFAFAAQTIPCSPASASGSSTWRRDTAFRRAAAYVDRILKGATPGDLPVELPSVFELVLNLKTARSLRLEIPSSVRLRATRPSE